MAKILPRTEHSEDIRVDIRLGVGDEDIVRRSPAPGDKLIEEVVRGIPRLETGCFVAWKGMASSGWRFHQQVSYPRFPRGSVSLVTLRSFPCEHFRR
jgi:hypothetical protein